MKLEEIQSLMARTEALLGLTEGRTDLPEDIADEIAALRAARGAWPQTEMEPTWGKPEHSCGLQLYRLSLPTDRPVLVRAIDANEQLRVEFHGCVPAGGPCPLKWIAASSHGWLECWTLVQPRSALLVKTRSAGREPKWTVEAYVLQ